MSLFDMLSIFLSVALATCINSRSSSDRDLRKLFVELNNWAWIQTKNQGSVMVIRDGKVIQPHPGFYLKNGDEVSGTGNLEVISSKGILTFSNKFNFRITISKKDDYSIFNVNHALGFLHYVSKSCLSKDCPTYNLTTPTVAIGIRGTELTINIEPKNKTESIHLISGQITISPLNNQKMIQNIFPGQKVQIKSGKIIRTNNEVL